MPQPRGKKAPPSPPPPEAEQGSEWEDLSPRERLSLSLDVINRTDLTPEEKLRLEDNLLRLYDSSTDSATETSPNSRSTSSPAEPPPTSESGETTSGDYWSPSPDLSLRQEDWPHFVIETTNRFLMVLASDLVNLEEVAKTMAPQGAHMLAMESQAAMTEVARVVAVRMNLAAVAASQPDLLVPDKRILDADGNPMKERPDA
jgi:hypothetical protein